MQPRYLIALIGGLLAGAVLNLSLPAREYRMVLVPLLFSVPTISLGLLIWLTELGREDEALKYLCTAAWSIMAVDLFLSSILNPSGFWSDLDLSIRNTCRCFAGGACYLCLPSLILVGIVNLVLSLTIQDRHITAFYTEFFKPVKQRNELWQVGICLGVYCFVVATFMA